MSEQTSSGPIRDDIQALRALAVLLVVFYHAGFEPLHAGYLGVDIFFVISGYLITGLVAREIRQGSFRFSTFYYRRAKRLLPPAFIVVLLTVVLAPFFVTDIVLEEMKSQVLGIVTFTSNFVLWQQSGYFDAAAEMKPFLHFWSLAIEEQYYLFMPLLLFCAPRRIWLWVVGLLLLISLLGCLWLVQDSPSSAFYLLPTRAWELAFGSLGALIGVKAQLRSYLVWMRWPAGIALLAVPFFPTGAAHPGLDSILVSVATLLLLLHGHDRKATQTNVLLRLFALFGNLSYSLYLVHWPVFVFTRAAWLEQPPASVMLIIVLVSLVLSIGLFRWVETPFRRGFSRPMVPVSIALLLTSCAIALAPFVLNGAAEQETNFKNLRRANLGIARACAFGKKYTFDGALSDTCRTKADASVLVWGDSYAMAYTTLLMEPLKDQGLEQATAAACDPVFGMARFPIEPHTRYNRAYARDCIALHKAILAYAINRDEIELVVLSARFETILQDENLLLVQGNDGYTEHRPSADLVSNGLAALADRLQDAGKRVVFLAPPPADGNNIGACLERRAKGQLTFGMSQNCSLSFDDVQAKRAITWEMLALAGQKSDTPVLSLRDFLCDDQHCQTSLEGTFLYRDAGHLSVEGARLIGARSDLAQKILQEAR